MSSQCLFHARSTDVMTFISTIEALRPSNSEAVAGSTNRWDALVADVAAGYFVGDALRWFEGLDAATQESWASLRATLLAVFGPYDDDWSDDDEYDELRGRRNSCLTAWPAPPPLSLGAIHEGGVGGGGWSEGVQAVKSSNNADIQLIDESYKVEIQRSVLQRLSTASRIGRRVLPRPLLASHMIIDLMETLPAHHRTGWKPIEIELPPSDSDIEPPTYRVTKLIPLSTIQLDYLRISFRLTEIPAPDEMTCISLRYNPKSPKYTSKRDYWRPNPLRLRLPPNTVIIPMVPYSSFCTALKPGVLIEACLAKTTQPSSRAPPPQLVVGWKFSG